MTYLKKNSWKGRGSNPQAISFSLPLTFLFVIRTLCRLLGFSPTSNNTHKKMNRVKLYHSVTFPILPPLLRAKKLFVKLKAFTLIECPS